MTNTTRTALRRLTQGLCLTAITATAALAYSQGRIQDISVTSRHGASVMSQFYSADRVSPQHTRVCLINTGPRERAFTHAVTGINPMRAAANGGKSCANFPSNARVAFGEQDWLDPSKTGVNMVMSLSAFKGGIVPFVWK